MAEKVIPNCINYADLKPEAIENDIRLIRYTPTSSINSARASDVVKFFLQGTGFYDPYSAYIQFTVNVTDLAANEVRTLDRSAHSFISRLVIRSQGVELERIEQYDVIAAMINDVIYSSEQQKLHMFEGFPQSSTDITNIATTTGQTARIMFQTFINNGAQPCDMCVGELCFNRALNGGTADLNLPGIYQSTCAYGTGVFGGRVLQNTGDGNNRQTGAQSQYTFTIPIYSGIIGVLQPSKKLIPLSLLPLEVEFTLNPHALYSNTYTGSRNYTVTNFEIFAHTMFFEQEVHRALETVVAEQGLFIHYNSFTLAPVTALGTAVGGYAQINVPHKSINSLHTVFLYNLYETKPQTRKLFFNSHNLTSYQVRNGSQLLPSEPILGNSGNSSQGQYNRFMIEMYKAWNKMHDPLSDGRINGFRYCIDSCQFTDFGDQNESIGTYNCDNTDAVFALLYKLAIVQAQYGLCQYGLSFEGEELGSDKTIVTGRRAMLPFDINFSGSKFGANATATSYMLTFVRSDAVLYVRPDLVVTVLGR